MNIDKSVFIADGAKLSGDNITIGSGSSVWYNAVIRCDEKTSISIGEKTNIQDLSLLHIGRKENVVIGDGVTVGHMCIIHGCTIGDNTLIGMGSTIMTGAKIGNNCIIGADSLITEGKEIPDGSIAFGRPAKIIKEMSDEQIEENRDSAEWYYEESRVCMNNR